MAADAPTKSIVVAETLTIGLIISLGAYLTSQDGHFHAPRTLRFLFWSPLGAMSLWINGAVSGWKKPTQIVFICLIAQNSIGFIDLGASLHTSWMYGCAALFFILALGFVIAWAEEINH